MFNLFIDKLHGIISQISSTSTQVAAASNQLHSTAEHIATGAEEVAAQSATVATAGIDQECIAGVINQAERLLVLLDLERLFSHEEKKLISDM